MEKTLQAAKHKHTAGKHIPMSWFTLLIVFVVGSIAGTLYEEVYVFILYRIWVNKSGLIYGPFNPLYGFAAAAMALLFRKIRNPFTLYTACALACGACEYFTHELEMLIFGTYSWNYAGKVGAIPSLVTWGATSGTTLPYIIYWGVLGLIFMKGALPLINKVTAKISINPRRIIAVVTVGFFVMNTFVTCAALFRQTQRHKGIEPRNGFWRTIDSVFDDEYLTEVYPTRPIPTQDPQD